MIIENKSQVSFEEVVQFPEIAPVSDPFMDKAAGAPPAKVEQS